MRAAGVLFRHKLRRDHVLAFFSTLPRCVVAMEACASAHYWAREIAAVGHDTKLISPAYVKLFVKRQKNDMAEAICEAAQHPTTGQPVSITLAPFAPYHPRVFLAPPWPEIYVVDRERRHGMDEAVAEYDRLVNAYGQLGYEPLTLPKASVIERAAFVLSHLR